jgi:NADH:ubiquinone oxidoreductase subunit 6 (subunit J)
LFLLECELLAFLFIIIYVGAIAVLFLFAIMMLESKLNNLSKNTMKYIPIGLVFGIFFSTVVVWNISEFRQNPYRQFYFHTYTNWYDLIDSVISVSFIHIFCAAIFGCRIDFAFSFDRGNLFNQ